MTGLTEEQVNAAEKFMSMLSEFDDLVRNKSIRAAMDFLKENQMSEYLQVVGYAHMYDYAANKAQKKRDEITAEQKKPEPVVTIAKTVTLTAKSLESDLKLAANSNSTAPTNIMAATGLGKSTKVPDSVESKGTIISVQPTQLIAESIHDFAKLHQRYTSVCDVGSEADLHAKIHYMTAETLLSRIFNDPSFLTNVTHIFVDECHVPYVTYYILMRVLYMFATHVKVFYMSASFDSRHSDFSRKKALHCTDVKPPGEIGSREWENSVFSAHNISSRGLVFCFDYEEAIKMRDYYHRNGVNAFSFTCHDTYKELKSINDKLAQLNGYPAVLCCDSSLGVGLTLNIDSVFNFGRIKELSLTVNPFSMKYMVRHVTEAEARQIHGRAGRLSEGRAYRIKRDYTAAFRFPKPQKFFVPLWYELFGIIPNEQYSTIKQFYGVLTKHKAAQLLSVIGHPALLFHYMDADGNYYKNTAPIIKSCLSSGCNVTFSHLSLRCPDRWFTYDYLNKNGEMVKLKSPFTFDSNVFPLLQWTLAWITSGTKSSMLLNDDREIPPRSQNIVELNENYVPDVIDMGNVIGSQQTHAETVGDNREKKSRNKNDTRSRKHENIQRQKKSPGSVRTCKTEPVRKSVRDSFVQTNDVLSEFGRTNLTSVDRTMNTNSRHNGRRDRNRSKDKNSNISHTIYSATSEVTANDRINQWNRNVTNDIELDVISEVTQPVNNISQLRQQYKDDAGFDTDKYKIVTTLRTVPLGDYVILFPNDKVSAYWIPNSANQNAANRVARARNDVEMRQSLMGIVSIWDVNCRTFNTTNRLGWSEQRLRNSMSVKWFLGCFPMKDRGSYTRSQYETLIGCLLLADELRTKSEYNIGIDVPMYHVIASSYEELSANLEADKAIKNQYVQEMQKERYKAHINGAYDYDSECCFIPYYCDDSYDY